MDRHLDFDYSETGYDDQPDDGYDDQPDDEYDEDTYRPHPYRIPDCAAKTRAGRICGFAARRESGLCINHDPAYREQQRQNVLKGARNSLRSRYEPPVALQLKDFDLTDRACVQALIEAALALEFAGQLSTARCRNIIRLLSIATRNLPNSAHFWTGARVREQQERYHEVRPNLANLKLALASAESEDAP